MIVQQNVGSSHRPLFIFGHRRYYTHYYAPMRSRTWITWLQGWHRNSRPTRPQNSSKIAQLIVSSEFTVMRPGCLSQHLLSSCSLNP